MDDLSSYAIAFFVYAISTWELMKYQAMAIHKIYQNMTVHQMRICNFKMEAVEFTVEARLFDESSHNGYSI